MPPVDAITYYRMPSIRPTETFLRRLDNSPSNLLLVPDYDKTSLHIPAEYATQIVKYSQFLKDPIHYQGRNVILPDYGKPDLLLEVLYHLGQMNSKISYYTTNPVILKER